MRFKHPYTYKELKEYFKDYFNNNPTPDGVKINACTKILDAGLFLESHFRTLDENPGNKKFMQHFIRLTRFRQALEAL